MSDWQPIETAPKDGTDILICMPGGQSDHFYPVCWVSDPDGDDIAEGMPAQGAWQCQWEIRMILTEDRISECQLKPMWKPLDHPPTSLCYVP